MLLPVGEGGNTAVNRGYSGESGAASGLVCCCQGGGGENGAASEEEFDMGWRRGIMLLPVMPAHNWHRLHCDEHRQPQIQHHSNNVSCGIHHQDGSRKFTSHRGFIALRSREFQGQVKTLVTHT